MSLRLFVIRTRYCAVIRIRSIQPGGGGGSSLKEATGDLPLEGLASVHDRIHFKGAVSRQSSSFCLILPVTRPQSLWNLK